MLKKVLLTIFTAIVAVVADIGSIYRLITTFTSEPEYSGLGLTAFKVTSCCLCSAAFIAFTVGSTWLIIKLWKKRD